MNDVELGAIQEELAKVINAGEHDYWFPMAMERRYWILKACGACESPIEARFLSAFAWQKMPVFFNPGIFCDLPFLDRAYQFRYEAAVEQGLDFVVLRQQEQVGDYRADFLIRARFHDRPMQDLLVIECDGHQFHERTKEQAQRDRERDRKLQQMGLRVFRYTGSELWRDSAKCAAEVADYLSELEYNTRP
jgi:very-short-patch-repair endonuclease